MSNIYIQEPPTEGKVLLETTVGDIDIELWSRESPKACRNFIQLCMEGYYDKTIFHRLVKEFIVQGGDPTGTGTGGNSVWGKPFKDEFHSRLRFVRRGLVAMANAGRDDNGSQFFFTLGPTQELQNKHTIFGKVGGTTIYNMLKLEEGVDVDENERPLFPHKILRAKILNNPFPDIVPRQSIKSLPKEKNKPKSTASATKNYSLLSFGEEAEEEEEEIDVLNKKLAGKGKSSHDLTSDPKLSSEAVSLELDKKPKSPKDKDSDQDEDEEEQQQSKDTDGGLTVDSVKEKLKNKASASSKSSKKHSSTPSTKSKPSKASDEESEEEEYYLGKADKDAEKQRIETIKNEFKQLKRSMKADQEASKKAKLQEEENKKEVEKNNEMLNFYYDEQKAYKQKKATLKKTDNREAATLELLKKFQSKISTAKETFGDQEESTEQNEKKEAKGPGHLYEDEDDDPTDESWLAKSLHNEVKEAVLAKDANRKDDDWYEIYDPKNPLNRRRRQENKRAQEEKWKKTKVID